jgi:hypothetical protein
MVLQPRPFLCLLTNNASTRDIRISSKQSKIVELYVLIKMGKKVLRPHTENNNPSADLDTTVET